MRWAVHGLIALLLTIVTLVGGVAWIISCLMPRWKWAGFFVIYAGLSVGAAFVAPIFGKERLPCFATEANPLKAHTAFYCIANRNYVTPQLADITKDLARHMAHEAQRIGSFDTVLRYLDGSFPIGRSLPLLPHLSHKDGRQLDLTFYYQDPVKGDPVAGPTWLGYFGFPQNAPDHCADHQSLSMRSDLGEIFPTVLMPKWELANRMNQAMMQWLNQEGQRQGLRKAFIEPYLMARWQVSGGIFKFQGCHAARHDDHIHIQL